MVDELLDKETKANELGIENLNENKVITIYI